ncbi:putative methionine/alanine importer small subunit [Haloactinopolyspora alba]|uniref:Putative methionine/alanine importer small subunit n=1 Tax=Haloactinopolyspora alba TaxID=648780 RepID=A0A2P8DGN4_9ACTN|nr:methionine/alanine import family NSS transporter small subunit [Haloactinopolyspora alba]PSK96390.1 putative methionine/alanine importer small subunit [Haloactinopolyspora alba]
MSTGAVVMLIIAIVIVWGGLTVSVIHLRRHPDQPNS